MADDGSGATLTLAVSGWTGNITGMRRSGMTRPSIKTTHLGTVGADTFIPADNHDEGSLELDIQYDPNVPPPLTAAAETVTLTYPIPTGQSNGATDVGSAFITDEDRTIAIGELMQGTFTLKWAGTVTQSDSS